MPSLEVDFIIVGQGLAGSILAHILIKRGQNVLVLDNAHAGSSSKVAAGIINPITGHRLNISERFFDYYPVAKEYYAALEKDTEQRFFRTIAQTRLIKNQGQYDYLCQRQSEREYLGLLKTSERAFLHDSGFGTIDVRKTALIDTKGLLLASKQWLKANGSYLPTEFDYSSLVVSENEVTLGSRRSKHIIFCEGYQAINNPWLKHLPFKLAKGEVLTINTPNERMLNWGQWLVPNGMDNTRAKLGSNFSWDDLNLTLSKEAKNKMLRGLSDHAGLSGQVISHEVGIRPTTKQRKPFVGALPKLNQAFCFNGFGSKGCLLIPFYANLLADHLLLKKPLPQELTQWI